VVGHHALYSLCEEGRRQDLRGGAHNLVLLSL
jgi:hypothetical protein